METGKKQDINTGSGSNGQNPILANENVSGHTVGESKPSQPHTKNAPENTKPVSMSEALGLLQTLCLDLRSIGCKVAILALENRLYVRIIPPASIGKITYSDEHIRINGVPVSDLAE